MTTTQARWPETALEKDPLRRLSWICIQSKHVLFVRAPGTPKFFDPGCRAFKGIGDFYVLKYKMQKELTVTLLEVQKNTSFRVQAFDKPEGQVIEMHLYLSRYLGKPSPTKHIAELEWFTSSEKYMALTTDGGRAVLQELRTQGLIL